MTDIEWVDLHMGKSSLETIDFPWFSHEDHESFLYFFHLHQSVDIDWYSSIASGYSQIHLHWCNAWCEQLPGITDIIMGQQYLRIQYTYFISLIDPPMHAYINTYFICLIDIPVECLKSLTQLVGLREKIQETPMIFIKMWLVSGESIFP